MASYNYITETGVIVPDTAIILTDVQNEYREAFGNDLVLSPETPQGVLITTETLARDGVVRNNANLANQINPNLATGTFLDAICALTGLSRVQGTYSVVNNVILTGVPSTIIPAGVIAETILGDRFESLNTIVLDSNGAGTVDFRSVELGSIGALPHTLTQIVTNILGWETVDNPVEAVLGTDEQSDQFLRIQRRRTLALQGVGLPEAIVSSLYATEGVRSLVFRENVTNITRLIDGISLLPHSMYVCVRGGTDEAVAASILANKSLGCDMNGNTTVNIIEPSSGQSYSIKFSRPVEIPILIRATVRADQSLQDPQTTVREAILAYVNGEIEGEEGFVVGTNVSAFELAGAINRITPGIYVQNMLVTKASFIDYSTAEIPISIAEIATTNNSSIQVILA